MNEEARRDPVSAPFRREPELADEVGDRLARDTEARRRRGLIAVAIGECFADQPPAQRIDLLVIRACRLSAARRRQLEKQIERVRLARDGVQKLEEKFGDVAKSDKRKYRRARWKIGRARVELSRAIRKIATMLACRIDRRSDQSAGSAAASGGRPLSSAPSHLWTSSASLSHLTAMSASIALAGSVGARSVKARQSAARPRYQSALDVVSLCTLIVPHATLMQRAFPHRREVEARRWLRILSNPELAEWRG